MHRIMKIINIVIHTIREINIMIKLRFKIHATMIARGFHQI